MANYDKVNFDNLINGKDRDFLTTFDTKSNPHKQPWYLKIVAWIMSIPEMLFRGDKLTRVNMKGIKYPFIALCNHNSFLDFKAYTKAMLPRGSTYIVAVDGFIKREGIMRRVGCISKRKFTNDVSVVKQVLYSLGKLKQSVAIYPEARYSLAGVNELVPSSLAKLLKLAKAPVVTFICHGHHIESPMWNLTHRNTRISSTMTQIITAQEIQSLSIEQINQRIQQNFVYDDYKWQLENNVKVKYKGRSEGLHKILYKCPNCLTEYKMDSSGCELFCRECGKRYTLSELGQISANDGVTEFSHIPDWYRWERQQTLQQILRGDYLIEDDVIIDALPNAKGFIPLGDGHVVFDERGVTLTGNKDGAPFELKRLVSQMQSVHIELNYVRGMDGIDITTLDENYYVYFKNLQNVAVKVHFGVEELYKLQAAQKSTVE